MKNEELLPEALLKLLELMASEDTTTFSDDGDSWKAYRVAEQLNDPELIPLLVRFVADESPQEDLKTMAFTVMRYVLRNSGTKEGTAELPGLLHAFGKNEQLTVETLRTICEVKGVLPEEKASEIMTLADDDRQSVRNWAIRALAKFEGNSDTIENVLIQVLQHYYDRYDLRYALEVLEDIGTKAALPHLESLLEMDEPWKDEAIPGVRSAMEAIRQRNK